MLGGTCCTPRALRTSANTTASFRKDVVITAASGNSASSASAIARLTGSKLPLMGFLTQCADPHADLAVHIDQVARADQRAVGADHDRAVGERALQIEYGARLQ